MFKMNLKKIRMKKYEFEKYEFEKKIWIKKINMNFEKFANVIKSYGFQIERTMELKWMWTCE